MVFRAAKINKINERLKSIFFLKNWYRASQLVKGMLAIAISFTHGLACYVAIDITWNEYVKKRLSKSSPKLVWEYVIRTLVVLITCKAMVK